MQATYSKSAYHSLDNRDILKKLKKPIKQCKFNISLLFFSIVPKSINTRSINRFFNNHQPTNA